VSAAKPYLTVPSRPDWHAHHSDVREMLGLSPKAKLPKNGLPAREVQGITVWVEPAAPAVYAYKPGFYVPRKVKSSTHRVRALCPQCGQEVSAGRLHQHAKMHEAEAR
jgi:hypothetical protein